MKEQLFYAVMYSEHAEFLGKGASYFGDKLLLKGLTNPEINQFTDTINRIDALGFNPTDDPEQAGLSITEFVSIIDHLANDVPNTALGVLSITQGQWLYNNHPAFMPTENTEV